MELMRRYVEVEGWIFEMKKRTEVKILKIKGCKRKEKGDSRISWSIVHDITLFKRKEPAGEDDLRNHIARGGCILTLTLTGRKRRKGKGSRGVFPLFPF